MEDEKFIDDFINQYSYTNKDVVNVYYIILPKKSNKPKHVRNKEIIPIHLNIFTWHQIKKTHKHIENIFLHNIKDQFFLIIPFLPKEVRLYWIFYGIEIYKNPLLMNILDENSKRIYLELFRARYKYLRLLPINWTKRILINKEKIRKFITGIIINRVDYFCHWNRLDFEIVKQSFPDFKAIFLEFAYDAFNGLPVSNTTTDNPKPKPEQITIMIGNCSRLSLNHLTILEYLKQFDQSKFKIICPLSYGDMDYKDFLKDYAQKIYPNNFLALEEILPFQEYYDLLSKIDLLIMNSYRTQGGGNIYIALFMGKKVYMNPKNTYYIYLINSGFFVHSTEKFLQSSLEEILTPLNNQQVNHNRFLIREYIKNETGYQNLP